MVCVCVPTCTYRCASGVCVCVPTYRCVSAYHIHIYCASGVCVCVCACCWCVCVCVCVCVPTYRCASGVLVENIFLGDWQEPRNGLSGTGRNTSVMSMDLT